MKQLLFLLLFPSLALAQYQGNANQKITLGEQTTADGLVFRGVENDTALITPFSDTSAYIILDTINNKFYNYNRSTNVWSLAGGGGGGISDGDKGDIDVTNSGATWTIDTSAISLSGNKVTGTLPVANGGTGITSMPAGYILHGDGTSVDTSVNLFWDRTNNRLGITTTSPLTKIDLGENDFTNSLIKMGTFEIQSLVTNNGFLQDNVFFNGSTFTYRNTGFGVVNQYFNGTWMLRPLPYQSIGTTISGSDVLPGIKMLNNRNVGMGKITEVTDNTLAGSTLFVDAVNERVAIGTTSPLAKLNVMGTVRINSASAPDANYYLQLENSSSQKAKANAWDTYSDKRIKTNIEPIINAIDKVNLLNPVYYQKHDSYVENDFLTIDYDSSVKSLGFIAQEVYNVIPEAVNTGTTNELWAMDYTKIIPILTKAIQEQQSLIKALEQRIINLENK